MTLKDIETRLGVYDPVTNYWLYKKRLVITIDSLNNKITANDLKTDTIFQLPFDDIETLEPFRLNMFLGDLNFYLITSILKNDN